MNAVPPSLRPAAGTTPPDDLRRLLGLPPAVWASAVLVAGLLFTAWVAHREWLDEHQRTQAAYAALADGSVLRLQAPLQDAASTLRAMQTVFLSNDHMDQQNFAQYTDNLRIAENRHGHVATVFARRRLDPKDPQRVAYPYELAAPLRGNESVIGLDIASQKPNLLALQRARDEDIPVISAPFPLRQFPHYPGHAALGVTVRLPVYSRGPIPVDVAERRRREIGALAISLRLEPLVREALHGQIFDRFQVSVRDLDAPRPTAFSILASLRCRRGRCIRGSWTSVADAGNCAAAEHGRPGRQRIRTTMVAGMTISLLLSLLLWSISTTRRRAVMMGQGMSERFSESEARFRTLNELLPALVLLADGATDASSTPTRPRANGWATPAGPFGGCSPIRYGDEPSGPATMVKAGTAWRSR